MIIEKKRAHDIIEKMSDRGASAKDKALFMVDYILNMKYPHNKFAELDAHMTFWEKVKDEIKSYEPHRLS